MLIDKLFFKKRWVFVTIKKLNQKILYERYICYVYENNSDIIYCNNIILKKRIRKRLAKKNWILFTVVDKKHKKIVAYYWGIYAYEDILWHDNFIIYPGGSLLCNAFVETEHRSRGLYSYLIFKAHEYMFNNRKINKIFTLVENSNNNSIKANRAAGLTVYCGNYLYKFFGFTLFSVFIKNSKIIMVLFGSNLLKKIIYINNKYL